MRFTAMKRLGTFDYWKRHVLTMETSNFQFSKNSGLKAMTHQPTQLLSWVGSGPVGVCVIGLQLEFLLHSSLVPDCLVGSGPPYDSTCTVELGWVMCHSL